MRRAGQIGLIGVLAALALTWSAPAHADSVGSIGEFGWWTKRPGAQAVVNGFEIARGVDGAESVAAFRIVLTGSVNSATFVVGESGDPNVAKVSGTPTMNVCVTTASWTADAKGTFDKAPKEDCTVSIPMKGDATRKWSADVTALLSGHSGSVSLMLVPAPPPAGMVVDPGFNRQFGPPLLQTDGTASTSPSSSSSPSTFSPPPATTQFRTGTVFPTPPAFPVPANPNGTVSAPVGTPAPVAQGDVTTSQGVTILGAARPAAAPKHWGRLLLYLPLAAIVGVAYTLVRKQIIARGLIPTGS
jgi:hypothetical protein